MLQHRGPEGRRVEVGRARFEEGLEIVVAGGHHEDDRLLPSLADSRALAELRRAHVGQRVLDDHERRRLALDHAQPVGPFVRHELLVPASAEQLGHDGARFRGHPHEQCLHGAP